MMRSFGYTCTRNSESVMNAKTELVALADRNWGITLNSDYHDHITLFTKDRPGGKVCCVYFGQVMWCFCRA